MEHVKDMILTIARALVDNPEQISINEVDDGNTVVYELTVAKSDIGKNPR